MVARRRVGVLVPSANSTVEPDFVLAAPKHVTVHANRIGWEAKNLTEDEAIVDRMNARVEEAASTHRRDEPRHGRRVAHLRSPTADCD